ncbi:class F sortase [Streptomyces griseorubiginosus]|uniref:class F sortase n=1 Tax=Streptomyces griseorubiginosus TaxID=67304 RepID=UPI00365AF5FC
MGVLSALVGSTPPSFAVKRSYCMRKPSPRHLMRIGLVLALLGLGVSAVMIIGTWPGRSEAGGKDFGPLPGSGSSPAALGRKAPPPSTPSGNISVPTTAARVAAPSSLSLPRLGLRAAIEAVGVSADGQVEVPEDPQRVGWYRFSPAPGSGEGSSVVVGHVDSDGRGLGVLVSLNDVRRGDRVVVVRTDGKQVGYRITSRRTVSKTDLAASGAFRREGPAVLTLITCTGPYRPDEGGYQNNLVVTAVEEPT